MVCPLMESSKFTFVSGWASAVRIFIRSDVDSNAFCILRKNTTW
jgi:hypothetical protein